MVHYIHQWWITIIPSFPQTLQSLDFPYFPESVLSLDLTILCTCLSKLRSTRASDLSLTFWFCPFWSETFFLKLIFFDVGPNLCNFGWRLCIGDSCHTFASFSARSSQLEKYVETFLVHVCLSKIEKVHHGREIHRPDASPVDQGVGMFVSSVRSSNSHTDLLLIHHPPTHQLFQITPVLDTGLSLSEPLQLYKGYDAI